MYREANVRYESHKNATADKTFYYTHDGLGSVKTLTDKTGKIVNQHDYTAFGDNHNSASIKLANEKLLSAQLANTQSPNAKSPNEKISFHNRYTYTGREQSIFAEHNAPMYYRWRMYTPNIGRFEKRDPIGYADGVNMYAYVNNRPIMLIDSTGSWTLKWEWNSNSHGSGKWASAEGHRADGSTIGIISRDFMDTQYAQKGRSGAPIINGNNLFITLFSAANSASFASVYGTGAYIQWSGENEYTITIDRNNGDSKYAKVAITASITYPKDNTSYEYANAYTFYGINTTLRCVCCNEKSIGIIHLTHAHSKKGVNLAISSELSAQATITPVDSCEETVNAQNQ